MSESFAALDHVPLGVLVIDKQMRVLFWNACLEDWTGVARAQALGRDVRERVPALWEARYAGRLRDLFEGGSPAVFSSQLHPHLVTAPLRSGRLRVEHTTAVAVPAEAGGFHALFTLQDVTSLSDAVAAYRGARDEARERAATDGLTGIGNRSHFIAGAARAVAQARRHGRDLALLMLDVDRFKTINDTHGHAAGDATLVRLASVCAASLREGDVLGRLGGDEFAVLLPEASPARAAQVAERLRGTLAETGVDWEGAHFALEVSVGVASLRAEGDELDTLLARADQALLEAKRSGRNCVVHG